MPLVRGQRQKTAAPCQAWGCSGLLTAPYCTKLLYTDIDFFAVAQVLQWADPTATAPACGAVLLSLPLVGTCICTFLARAKNETRWDGRGNGRLREPA